MYDLPHSAHTYGGTVNKNLYPTELVASPITVIARRLETILTEQHLPRLDLLKIDVESHEPAVIEGIDEKLYQLRPSMIVEIWNDEMGQKVEANHREMRLQVLRDRREGTIRATAVHPSTRQWGALYQLPPLHGRRRASPRPPLKSAPHKLSDH
jgi:hypothetical protein